MNYSLTKDVISLVEEFEKHNQNNVYTADMSGFEHWFYEQKIKPKQAVTEPDWEGKDNGRSPESVINTLIVHLNRYAKTYSKSAIYGSDFSTQEEFIYLINLKAFGAMTKMELIKKNIQEKPVGIQIINRLIKQGWAEQTDSEIDKRSKVVRITQKGLEALENQMQKIRQATQIVTGDLTYSEKMELITLLNKLDRFHHPIYCQNINTEQLLEAVVSDYSFGKN